MADHKMDLSYKRKVEDLEHKLAAAIRKEQESEQVFDNEKKKEKSFLFLNYMCFFFWS